MSIAREMYDTKVRPELCKQFNYKNPMQVPGIDKIVINFCSKDAVTEGKKAVEALAAELELIAGQKPILTNAKKSIAGFKLREGMPIGGKVTLRGKRMYDFFERLSMIALPRIRDFRGLSAKSFDGRGNYSLGIKEQIVFPEIDYDTVTKMSGFDITITTTAKTDAEGYALLKGLGLPLQKQKQQEK